MSRRSASSRGWRGRHAHSSMGFGAWCRYPSKAATASVGASKKGRSRTHTTERKCCARCAKGVLHKAVIRCSPGFSVGQPWVLGLLAQVVWLTQSGPEKGPHFPPVTAAARLHGVEVHPDACCPWRSRNGIFCSACFLRPRLAFYIAHASLQATRSSYTRSTSQAQPSAYCWPHSRPPHKLLSCQLAML